jgi:hypothetical protein
VIFSVWRDIYTFCNKASGDFEKYPTFQMVIPIDWVRKTAISMKMQGFNRKYTETAATDNGNPQNGRIITLNLVQVSGAGQSVYFIFQKVPLGFW